MKYIAVAALLLLTSMAGARLVTIIVPPESMPQRQALAPLTSPTPPKTQYITIVKVVKVVERTSPSLRVQYLDGSTSDSPQWKERYPGIFVRIR